MHNQYKDIKNRCLGDTNKTIDTLTDPLVSCSPNSLYTRRHGSATSSRLDQSEEWGEDTDLGKREHRWFHSSLRPRTCAQPFTQAISSEYLKLFNPQDDSWFSTSFSKPWKCGCATTAPPCPQHPGNPSRGATFTASFETPSPCGPGPQRRVFLGTNYRNCFMDSLFCPALVTHPCFCLLANPLDLFAPFLGGSPVLLIPFGQSSALGDSHKIPESFRSVWLGRN